MSYLEAASGLTTGIASLAQSITLGKFIRWIFVLILISAVVFYAYDRYSSTFYYNKLERKLEIIATVQKLSYNDSSIIRESKKKLFEVLNAIDPKVVSTELNLSKIWIYIIKVLGAIVFPVLIIIGNRNSSDKENVLLGSILFIVIFGAIAAFLPILYSLWVNFFIMPLAQILVLIPFILKSKK
jgi:hypothetical protein